MFLKPIIFYKNKSVILRLKPVFSDSDMEGTAWNFVNEINKIFYCHIPE